MAKLHEVYWAQLTATQNGEAKFFPLAGRDAPQFMVDAGFSPYEWALASSGRVKSQVQPGTNEVPSSIAYFSVLFDPVTKGRMLVVTVREPAKSDERIKANNVPNMITWAIKTANAEEEKELRKNIERSMDANREEFIGRLKEMAADPEHALLPVLMRHVMTGYGVEKLEHLSREHFEHAAIYAPVRNPLDFTSPPEITHSGKPASPMNARIPDLSALGDDIFKGVAAAVGVPIPETTPSDGTKSEQPKRETALKRMGELLRGKKPRGEALKALRNP